MCVCVCVCVCVRTISANAPNKHPKKGHHKNQCPMGKIFLKSILKLQLFPVYTVSKVGHFVTSVSMCKGLHAG